MGQLLHRGTSLSDKVRIGPMLAEGDKWQIYRTNLDTFALAVKPELYESWRSSHALPTGVFLENQILGCHIFLGSGDNIISSLNCGPYPENAGQIEAFSIAFRYAEEYFKSSNIRDGIYIEEYSLLLPVLADDGAESATDAAVLYGRWLTGGASVSINSFSKVRSIMSWLPAEMLRKYAELAGFTVDEAEEEGCSGEDEAQEERIIAPTFESGEENSTYACTQEGRFSLPGRPELEAFFNSDIIDVIQNREEYERMGIHFPGATVLYGPPGCGKTYAVERLSEYLGWKLFTIDSASIGSSYIHETGKKIAEIFNSAIKAAPSILIIDEMEAFLSDRSSAGPSGGYHFEEVAEFLRRIPEATSKNVLIFAMTNMIDLVDPAILRRGRFDYIIEVKMAEAEEIEALLKVKFAGLPIDESVDATKISKELSGHPLSDVTFVLKEAGKSAVKNGKQMMDSECFDTAINALPKNKEARRIGFEGQ